MCTVAGTILGHGKLCWLYGLGQDAAAAQSVDRHAKRDVSGHDVSNAGVVVLDTGVPAPRVLLILPGTFFILVWFRDFCLRPGSPGHLSCRIIFSLYIYYAKVRVR